jgi:hypothetical protein
LDVGGVNHHCDQQAAGVGDNVALSAFHLLAGVEAALPAAFGGFERLAVDHPRRRACLAPFGSSAAMTK